MGSNQSSKQSGGGRSRGGRGRGGRGRGGRGRGGRGRGGRGCGGVGRARGGARGGRGSIGRQHPPAPLSPSGQASGLPPLPPSSQTAAHETPPGGPPKRRRIDGTQDTGDGAGSSGVRSPPLPVQLWYNEDVLSDDAKGECIICLEELSAGDIIARLPCLCVYHKRCIEQWFGVQKACPVHLWDSAVSALLTRPG